jgi:pimeloyl-ACP methyl ester carboxylesterase
MRALYLEEQGGWLRYHDLPGREPARVFLHGLGSASSADFPAVVACTALAGHRSLLIDLLGFGFSDRPAQFDYTLEGHAHTVAMLLESLRLTECAVIGHSLGGSVAIALASLYPELVSRLVVAEANLDPGPEEGSNAVFSRSVAAQTERDFIDVGYHSLVEQMDSFSSSFAALLRISDPRAIYRTAVSLVDGTRPTLRERFLKLPIPRAYIFGEYSLQNEDLAQRAKDLPVLGVPVFIVPKAGHGMGVTEDPTDFSTTLNDALNADEYRSPYHITGPDSLS